MLNLFGVKGGHNGFLNVSDKGDIYQRPNLTALVLGVQEPKPSAVRIGHGVGGILVL